VANKAGKFTQPTSAAVTAALASFPAAPASGAESLINTSAPAGYAIINYEYAIVKKTQPSAAEATAVKAFLNWIVTTGNGSTYLSTVDFEPLPSATLSVSKTLISSISG
jgi:phosphate transport system substrate-binding protein